MATLLSPEETADLATDVEKILEPIEQFLQGLSSSSSVDHTDLVFHLFTVDELLVSLRSFVTQLHSRLYDQVVAPVPILSAELHAREQQVISSSDPRAPAEQQWVKTDAGQWKLDIPEELLVELLEQGFTNLDCAALLGTSLATIKRRKTDLGLTKARLVDQAISDDDLKEVNVL